MKIRAKIKALREQKGLTQDDLARLSGVSIQSIRRYEGKDDANITLDILEKIAKALNSNVVYFVSQCLPMSPSENELSPNGVNLSPNMSPNAEFLSPNPKKSVVNPPKSHFINIPVYDEVFASAGNGRFNDEFVSFYASFDKALLKSYFRLANTQDLSILNAIGDSMTPTLPPNARLLMQKRTEFKEGQIVLARLDDELFVKRLHKQPHLKLVSDNEKYEPITLAGKDYELIGVIVGFFKAFDL